ncbi:TPA: O17/O44/O73/O77/O106 family O-antigen polymerase, partial [Escherichia coli]|nr:O17/O44/O73/O77/O106 family O-antigen polymerase [Escherichia coli]HCB3811506.1 O17/O44/O73/O77/O106 family O-antigen polymerase [Escherichia coli]
MHKQYYSLLCNKIQFKHLAIYFSVFLSLSSCFLWGGADTFVSQVYIDILATISTALLVVLMFYYYINRVRYLSLTLLFAFVFSLIIGLPSIYLYYFKNANHGFEIICIWGMLINSILYLQTTETVIKEEKRYLTSLFYILFSIVALCQLYKILIYLMFILNSGEGHLAIYTESEELLSQVPFFIRAISGFAVVMSLSTFYFKTPTYIKVIAFVLLASDLAIGIR